MEIKVNGLIEIAIDALEIAKLNGKAGLYNSELEAIATGINALKIVQKYLNDNPTLSTEEIFKLAEPFGEFKHGDAQGDKRIAYARAVEAALNQKRT